MSEAGRRGRSRAPARRHVVLGGEAQPSRRISLEALRRWGFLAVLAWSPLPLGSDRPWARSLLALLVVALLAISAGRALVTPGERMPLGQLRWPGTIGAVLVAWILLQDLPGGLFGWHHPLWDQASDMLGESLSPSLSIARELSLVHLLKLLTYAGVFLVSWQIAQRPEHARLIVKSVAVLGALNAFYGIIEFASPHPSILWMRKWAYVLDATSTFVNRNSFATFAGLALLASLVLIAETLIKNIDARSRTTLLLSTIDNILWRNKWQVLGLLVTGSGLLLSHSRAGMLASACGMVALAGAVSAAPSLHLPGRRSFIWFAAAAALVALAVSGTGTIERLLATVGDLEDGRTELFRVAVTAIGDNLFGGTGLGSFQFIFPMYQSLWFDRTVDLAHNDYLENMLELGVPAALLLFAIIALLVHQCALGVLRRGRDALYPCLGLAASVLVAVHSLFDFSLQIAAVTCFYLTLLGVGTAQALSSRRAEGEAARPPVPRSGNGRGAP